MVILGSPHFSLAEFPQLAPLVAGSHAHPRVRFLVTSSRLMKEHAAEPACWRRSSRSAREITLDTCILASPMLPPEIKTLMTNSAKYAYYAPGLLNTRVTFGSLADCVRSAIEGRVVRDESVWLTLSASICRPGGRRRRGRRRGAGDRTSALVLGRLRFPHRRDHRQHHPLAGVRAAGRMLAVPFSKGSSTTTAVLLEAVRAGTAPAAIVTTGVDAFFALASIVADVMYGKSFPVIALEPPTSRRCETGERLDDRIVRCDSARSGAVTSCVGSVRLQADRGTTAVTPAGGPAEAGHYVLRGRLIRFIADGEAC